MREDIVNSIPEAPVFDRREFLVTSIFAAGTFASAVLPIQGQTKITTDANGLVVGEVKIPVSDGEIPAYRAMPDKKGKKFPVVLVVHEIFGVHEWIQDVSRRFAQHGYMAIAPALYEMLSKQPKKDCPISLQNHGDEAWFRDIKIRR